MQLRNNVLAVLALAMTATALPAPDVSLVAKGTALSARADFCIAKVPACCVTKPLMSILGCIASPPDNCGGLNASLCCPEVGAVYAKIYFQV